jgi:methylphosphotriester-DNA--protein-cysteine methyltransferase
MPHRTTTDDRGAWERQNIVAIRRVKDRMDREYASPLNIEQLARGAHMSAGHLSREFRRIYGESPYQYLMTRRVERAMTFLLPRHVQQAVLGTGRRLSLRLPRRPFPRRRGHPALPGEAGDETDQESRSAGRVGVVALLA